jgi:signal transduction histidine kinase
MREDLKKTYRGATLLNLAFAAGITLLLLLLMVEHFETLRDTVTRLGAYMNIYSAGVVSKYMTLIITVLCMFIFALLFMLLQNRQVLYLKKIVAAMEEISKGNLDVEVPVEGDDEFAQLAASLNIMADDIQTLIAKERATEQSKNELITNVAHDLRTPLTSILGYLELLEGKPDLDAETRQHYVGIACKKARQLQQLIEELFGFTKLSYGRLAVSIDRVDIVKLLEQLIDEFYPVFENNGMECSFTTQVRSLMMNGDGKLLARLFDNLLNNAVKYGREGKVILVKLTCEEPVITITVTNFGYVIPEEEIPLLFNKFYRVEQSRSSSTGGTGLGLAIVKNIAELHGGTVECTSDIRGTTFKVKLPSDFDINKERFKTLDGEHVDYEMDQDEHGNARDADRNQSGGL